MKFLMDTQVISEGCRTFYVQDVQERGMMARREDEGPEL